MNEQNKYQHWLLPALALLVIFQAALISSQRLAYQGRVIIPPALQVVPIPTKMPVVTPILIDWNNPAGELRVGQTVTAVLTTNKMVDEPLAGVDVVLSYDPKSLQITKSEGNKKFGWFNDNLKKTNEGRAVFSLLDESGAGVKLDAGEQVMSVTFKLLKKGETKVNLVKASTGVTTVFTAMQGSRRLSFESPVLSLTIK